MNKELIVIGVIIVVLMALVLIVAVSIFVVCTARIQSHDERLKSIELRLNNMSDGAQLIDAHIREANKRIDNIWKHFGN